MLLEAGRRTQLRFGEGGNSGEAICNPTGLRDLLRFKVEIRTKMCKSVLMYDGFL